MLAWHDERFACQSSRCTATTAELITFDRTAIENGNVHRSGVLGSNTVDDRWRFMKVYANLHGHWQVVAFFAAHCSKP